MPEVERFRIDYFCECHVMWLGTASRAIRSGVFAEFETNLRKGRQLEGIAKAKAAGVYKGRPASIDAARVRELKGRQDDGYRAGVGLSGAGRPAVMGWSNLYSRLKPDRIR